ncbi:hypothetical protein DFH29DRAFT_1077424 [Suillus ampliporus]|nr:hypothetical protein DFH29DRAFT_1077424 [Suillus ampliporus]
MNVTTVSATDFPIKSVKIFSLNVAEVTRVFPLDFTQSPNESQVIEISKLPGLSHPSGLRASVTTGSDDVLVMDYYYKLPGYTSGNLFSNKHTSTSSDVLRDLEAKCTRLEDERRLRKQSFAFLSTYMNALAKGDTPNVTEPAELATFFDEFVEIGKSRSEVITVLDQQIMDVQKEKEKEIQRLQAENSCLVTTVTVVLGPVSGRTATIAELELKYRVRASWNPVYEVHLTTIDSVPSSSVGLTYRCQISQSTGENWDNVELAVTKAESNAPLLELPEPKKMEIRQLSQPSSYHQPGSWPLQATQFWNIPGYASPFGDILSSTKQAGQSIFGSAQSAGHQADPGQGPQEPAADNLFGAFQKQPMPHQTTNEDSKKKKKKKKPTTTTEGLVGSAPAQSSAGQGMFGASQSQFPAQPQASSSSSGGSTATDNTPDFKQPASRAVLAELDKDIIHSATTKVFIPSCAGVGIHHVLIASIPLTASFTRVAVPSVDTRVFFTCEILNTSNYVLAPGTVHAYLDGEHVSDSNITGANQPQTIQFALGVDPAVTTQFNRTVDSLPQFTMYNGQTVTAHTLTTIITNTHQDPVSNVIVRTSLPIPADPRITVSLQEPEGLADIDSGMVQVRDGWYARWSTTGDRAGKNDGLFEWVCSHVKPGSEVLKAVWYVAAPCDIGFTEQEHLLGRGDCLGRDSAD